MGASGGAAAPLQPLVLKVRCRLLLPPCVGEALRSDTIVEGPVVAALMHSAGSKATGGGPLPS